MSTFYRVGKNNDRWRYTHCSTTWTMSQMHAYSNIKYVIKINFKQHQQWMTQKAY